MMGGSPRHGGQSAFVGPLEPRRAWSLPTQGAVLAQPVFGRDGTVYVGSLDHHFYAIRKGGALRWKVDAAGPIYGAGAVGRDGTVYFGSDSDRVYAVSPGGDVRWVVETERDADTGVALSAAGEILIGCGPELLAIRPTGRLAWRFRARDKVFSSPAIADDGAILFGSQDDHLYALNSDGTLRWAYRTGGDVDSAPAIADDGTVVVGSDDARVHAVAPDGTLRWSREVGGAVRAGIAFGIDGSVLVGTYGPRPRFVSLDFATGEERWAHALRPVASRDVGIQSPAAVDAEGSIYFGANDDFLYSLRPDGGLRWVFATGADVDSGPSIATDGTLVFGSADHVVYALGGGVSPPPP